MESCRPTQCALVRTRCLDRPRTRHNCHRSSTASRYIVHGASAEDLAELTGELIDDALELISDDVSDQLRSDIIDAYNERYTSSPVVVGVQGVEELRADIIDAYKVNG